MITAAMAVPRGALNEHDRYGRVSQLFHLASPRSSSLAGALMIGMYFALLAVFALQVLGILKHAFVDRYAAMFARLWGR